MSLRERGGGLSDTDTKKNRALLEEGASATDTSIAPLTSPGRERTGWWTPKRVVAGVTAAVVAPVVGWATLRPKHDGESKKQNDIPGVVTTANADNSIPTRVTVTTEAPTTTTTEVPEVFRSPVGELLKRLKYSAGDAQKVVDLVTQVQSKSDTPVLYSAVGGADRLRLIDLAFDPESAEKLSKTIDDEIKTESTSTIKIPGMGEGTIKLGSRNPGSQAEIILPIGAPLPPDFSPYLKDRTTTGGVTIGDSTVIVVDTTKPKETQQYQMDSLEYSEEKARKASFTLVSKRDVVEGVRDDDLALAVFDIGINHQAKTFGMKAAGYPRETARAYINGTDGKNGNIVTLPAFPGKQFTIPPFEDALWDSMPNARPWR